MWSYHRFIPERKKREMRDQRWLTDTPWDGDTFEEKQPEKSPSRSSVEIEELENVESTLAKHRRWILKDQWTYPCHGAQSNEVRDNTYYCNECFPSVFLRSNQLREFVNNCSEESFHCAELKNERLRYSIDNWFDLWIDTEEENHGEEETRPHLSIW